MSRQSTAIVLDGKLVAEKIQHGVESEIKRLKEKTGLVPGLTVIIVGDDPASKIYVNTKRKKAVKLGIQSEVIELPADSTKEVVIDRIKRLNENSSVDAVLVQLPLPSHLNTWEILDFLGAEKDVDRFHPFNQGMVLLGRTSLYPCTPFGILEILDHYRIDVTGLNTVVVGRSFIVGKPMAAMLTNRNATVTLCHSKSKALDETIRQADLLVAAVGIPGFVTPDMVKEGSILIDVGTNYLNNQEDVEAFCSEAQQKKFLRKGYAICGDIHIDAHQKSAFYTPVPGGVGAMTPAMLMYNTVELFKRRIKDS